MVYGMVYEMVYATQRVKVSMHMYNLIEKRVGNNCLTLSGNKINKCNPFQSTKLNKQIN